MSHARANTDLQLPSQSKHGVIMKTSAFHDPDTKQVSWCVANKTISGEWKILEFKTEVMPGDDPDVENIPYKSDKPLNYGEVVSILADYESIRKNSGMLESVADYITTKNIPAYRDVAHSDGIIFDKQGNPHPTIQGNVVTQGKFSTSEMMAVVDAVQNPPKELSLVFAQVQQPAQQVFQNQAYSQMLERTVNFIQAVFNEMNAIDDTNFISYTERYIPFFGISRGRLQYSGKEGPFKGYVNGAEYGYYVPFGQKNFAPIFDEIYQSLKKSETLPKELQEESLSFLYGIGVILSSQILYAIHCDPKKKKINENEISGTANLEKIRKKIMEAERNTLKSYIKTYGSKKISKKELESYVDQICAAALDEKFPSRIEDVKKIGEALIAKLQFAIKGISAQPQLLAPAPAKP